MSRCRDQPSPNFLPSLIGCLENSSLTVAFGLRSNTAMPHPRRYRDVPIRDAGMALATLGGGESDSDGVRLEATSYPPYLCRYHRSRPVLSVEPNVTCAML